MKCLPLCLLVLVLGLMGCGDDTPAELPDLAEVDRIAHAVSTILVQVKEAKRSEGEARKRAWDLWDLVRKGKPFAEVASQNSDDASRLDGGFMGFLPTHHDTALAGALQALRPGQLSPPVRTRIGYQVLYRHTFDEAVAIERKKWIAVYGIYVKWDKQRSKEAAFDLAERIIAQLKAGEITLTEARDQYAANQGIPQNAFLGATPKRPARQILWDAVTTVAEGEFVARPVETENGWGVFRRGRYLRAVVKHILIQDSKVDLTVPRLPAEAQALAARLHKELQADRSLWSRYVKNHSDDAGTRGDDGLLDTVATGGAIDAGFEALVRETKPGDLGAKPIYTRYGWHIIWRLK